MSVIFRATLLWLSGMVLVEKLAEGARAPPTGGATVVTFFKGNISIDDVEYPKWSYTGFGPHWKMINGIGCIDVPWGESFQVLYENKMGVSTDIHQHGLTPPSLMDGVPYISQVPLYPNRSRLVTFDIFPQNVGTYFIHSHFYDQVVQGLRVPLIIRGNLPKELPLADQIGEAQDILMHLEDFGAYPIDAPETSGADYWNAKAVSKYLKREWAAIKHHLSMSECQQAAKDEELAYRYHLANGKTLKDPVTIRVQPGELIRLRVINAASMTNYKLAFGASSKLWGGTPPTVIAVDGQYIKPYTVKNNSFWVSAAQRADIVIRMPPGERIVPIFAAAGGSGANDTGQRLFGRSGILLLAGSSIRVPLPGAFSARAPSGVGFMGRSLGAGTNFGQDLYLSGIDQEAELRALFPLSPKSAAVNVILNLTGNNGYNSINEASYVIERHMTRNPNPIVVKRGQRVCITFVNYNSDAHPMHLHGHTFQVTEINSRAMLGAMRDTVLVPAGGCNSLKICFDADNDGLWPLHCHSSFHLGAGMITTVEYAPTSRQPAADRWMACRQSITERDMDEHKRTSIFVAIIAAGAAALLLVFKLASVRDSPAAREGIGIALSSSNGRHGKARISFSPVENAEVE